MIQTAKIGVTHVNALTNAEFDVPFQKGQSGNPGGRPKVTLDDGRSLSDIAKEHTKSAVEALVSVLNDKASQASARVQAATALLDRGWGRPHQTTMATSAQMSLADELDAAVKREEARLKESRSFDKIDAYQ